MDRLGRQIEFMSQNPVTRAVIDSPCLDCQNGQSVAGTTAKKVGNGATYGNGFTQNGRGRGRYNNYWRGNNGGGRWNWSRGYRRNYRGNNRGGYRNNYGRYNNYTGYNNGPQTNNNSSGGQGNWPSTVNAGTSGADKVNNRKFPNKFSTISAEEI